MLKNIGTLEIVIIAVVILMLFGAKKLPEFARGLVNARKEFDKSFKEKKDDDKKKKQ